MSATIQTNAYLQAQRYLGMKEVPGVLDNPLIVAMLQLDANEWASHDEVPWCSAFVNWVAWTLGLPRTKTLMARDWLKVGVARPLHDADPAFDVVILSRGENPEAGHVGFFSGWDGHHVHLLGGNQGNTVSVAGFEQARVLGVRRLLR